MACKLKSTYFGLTLELLSTLCTVDCSVRFKTFMFIETFCDF